MPRCPYVYPSGDRCIYDDHRLADDEMCYAHKQETKKRETDRAKKRKRREAKKPAQHKLPKSLARVPSDPSAPWCTCTDRGQVVKCSVCGKPTYARYMTDRSKA